MVKLAAKCQFTLVGKFTYTMPKVELIRKSFIIQTQLSGGVKITHFNARHVYIDLDNELDYITVCTKQKISIEGQLMRIQKWTPTFRLEEETPIAPIWLSLHELPWHFYNKEFLTVLLNSIRFYIWTLLLFKKLEGVWPESKYKLISLKKEPLMFGWDLIKRM
ncbi:hypothetical protein H5410_050574 [Solanum commersonii]|uniref:DUF4283 domain-containing protein n=1 Tax=Solanum commersonii TaxID=4109 RepID=A0A9J5WVV3_SOLCO|nr:hypothetical protein H5410_050574 [Solanum commersonii]